MAEDDGSDKERSEPVVVFQDSGQKRTLSNARVSAFVPLSIRDGTASIPSIPQATRFGDLTSPEAQRLAEMALHEISLCEAEAALAMFRATVPDEDNGALCQALLAAAHVTYARCFANTPERLEATRILAVELQGLAAHEHAMALRSKHVAHDINDRRVSVVAAILDDDGNHYGIALWQGIAEPEDTEIKNLHSLIQHALAWVRAERNRLTAIVKHQVDLMTNEERLALSPPVFRSATPKTVKSSRRQPRT